MTHFRFLAVLRKFSQPKHFLILLVLQPVPHPPRPTVRRARVVEENQRQLAEGFAGVVEVHNADSLRRLAEMPRMPQRREHIVEIVRGVIAGVGDVDQTGPTTVPLAEQFGQQPSELFGEHQLIGLWDLAQGHRAQPSTAMVVDGERRHRSFVYRPFRHGWAT